jgi:hypothetical protein
MKAWRCCETLSPEGELEMTMKLNSEQAIQNIKVSNDRNWLLGFRDRIGTEGQPEIVSAIDHRLTELAEQELRRKVGRALGTEASLMERVQEALRVYQEGLNAKHGRCQPASRLRPMIEKWGEGETVRRLVTTHDKSTGLDLLDKIGRLDCAFEQIILDFANEYDNDPQLLAKAWANLARLGTSRRALEQ